jgi:anti-sigma regulatory factor (Ser/Thr protein kinase)
MADTTSGRLGQSSAPATTATEAEVVCLPFDGHAAGIARRFVIDNRDHVRADLIDDALVSVSEIVTNAVLHGRAQITLAVRVERFGIRIEVADSGEKLPRWPPEAPSPWQPSGRGLVIVDTLASAWGVTPNPAPLPGKVVWFELHEE